MPKATSTEAKLLGDVLQRTHDAEMGYQDIADCTTDPASLEIAVGEVAWHQSFGRELGKAVPHIKDGQEDSGTLQGWLLRRWKDLNAMVGSNRGMLKAAAAGNDAIVRSDQTALESNPGSSTMRDSLHRRISHVHGLQSKLRQAIRHLS